MKKTVFKGTVNGIHFDDVKKYNEYLTKLIESGETFTAETSTQTVDCTETVNDKLANNLAVYDEKFLLPYFSDDVDEYYLDVLVTDNNVENKNLYNKVSQTLAENYEYIKKYLADSRVSHQAKKEYIDNVLDVINMMKQDAEHNEEAFERLLKTRAEAEKEYEATIAEARDNYQATISACDTEERVLKGADVMINKFKEFYNNVLALTSEHIDKKDCCDKCCEGDCKCGKHAKTEVMTEVKEKTKQQVKDINTLFNKIFGVNLDDLSKHLNA